MIAQSVRKCKWNPVVLRWVPTQTNFLWLLLKIVIISVIDIIATNKRHYCKFEYKYKSIWLKISIFQIVKCPSYCAKFQSTQILLLYISNKNDICSKLRETTVVIWRYSWIISIKTFRFLKTFKSFLKIGSKILHSALNRETGAMEFLLAHWLSG